MIMQRAAARGRLVLLVQRADEAGLDREIEVVRVGGQRRGRDRRADRGVRPGGADHAGRVGERAGQRGGVVDRRHRDVSG
jgi:hypothetical protein